jgi:cell division protein YceG involved in septum cleavage
VPRRAKALLALLVMIGVLVVPLLIGIRWVNSLGVTGGSDTGKKIRLVVRQGLTTNEIAQLLERKGVIESTLGFRVAAFLHSGGESI